MKKLLVLAFFVVPALLTFSLKPYEAGAEGISRVSSASETVSAAPGKSVSARCGCPRDMELISGGGECFGFLVTEGRAGLAKSAPSPDGSSWQVECVNSGTRPGDIQARAWAVCADSAVFTAYKKK
ncbi:MAG TPA: hypothetical protein VHC46_03240 [Thermodesulfobacteriota bacterium]|nr:hypothetical protein [Thermodesulfobacteriota bacterium]